MNKKITIMFLAVFLVNTASFAFAQNAGAKFSKIRFVKNNKPVTQQASAGVLDSAGFGEQYLNSPQSLVQGQVVKIDAQNKTVTVYNPSRRIQEVYNVPEVAALVQMKVGDQIQIFEKSVDRTTIPVVR